MLKINTDGACFGNPGPMGIGVVVEKGGRVVRELSEYIGKGTNNVAEYTALLRAVELALELEENEVEIRSDSQLLVKQMKGDYKMKAPHLRELRNKILALSKGMKIEFKWIRREENCAADLLSKQAIENMEKVKGKC